MRLLAQRLELQLAARRARRAAAVELRLVLGRPARAPPRPARAGPSTLVAQLALLADEHRPAARPPRPPRRRRPPSRAAEIVAPRCVAAARSASWRAMRALADAISATRRLELARAPRASAARRTSCRRACCLVLALAPLGRRRRSRPAAPSISSMSAPRCDRARARSSVDLLARRPRPATSARSPPLVVRGALHARAAPCSTARTDRPWPSRARSPPRCTASRSASTAASSTSSAAASDVVALAHLGELAAQRLLLGEVAEVTLRRRPEVEVAQLAPCSACSARPSAPAAAASAAAPRSRRRCRTRAAGAGASNPSGARPPSSSTCSG